MKSQLPTWTVASRQPGRRGSAWLARATLLALGCASLVACGAPAERAAPAKAPPTPSERVASEPPAAAEPDLAPRIPDHVQPQPRLAQAQQPPEPQLVRARAEDPLPPAPEGAKWIEEFFPDGKRKSARTVVRDEDGIVNHGPFRRWLENGVLAEDGAYERGEKHGRYVVYYDTGIPESIAEYDRGREHGVMRRYSIVNECVQESHFVGGKREGVERLWWDAAHLRAYTNWKDDLPHGEWTQWHFDGSPSEHGRYRDGRREGEWTYRTPVGELLRVENYLEGRLHGRLAEYDEQGALVREGQYQNGVAEGLQVEFHPGGTARKSAIHYAGGRPNGSALAWRPDGTRESEGEMRDGLREGRWTYWNSDGSVHAKLSGTYRAGERVGD
jgi:antitoxin component YwqK of YwqJK toxin-antitoxin module